MKLGMGRLVQYYQKWAWAALQQHCIMGMGSDAVLSVCCDLGSFSTARETLVSSMVLPMVRSYVGFLACGDMRNDALGSVR